MAHIYGSVSGVVGTENPKVGVQYLPLPLKGALDQSLLFFKPWFLICTVEVCHPGCALYRLTTINNGVTLSATTPENLGDARLYAEGFAVVSD